MISNAPIPFVTLGELGDTLGVQSWRIARVFELGLVPEPPRVGRRRMIPKELIPDVIDALRFKGWLPPAARRADRRQFASGSEVRS